MCFISWLFRRINTFCNEERMTGMGSRWQVIGQSLSVWQYMVVFVSGGNPARKGGEGGGGERDGNGLLQNSCENKMDQKWAFVYRLRLVDRMPLYSTDCMSSVYKHQLHIVTSSPNSNPVTGLCSGQGLRKEQGGVQGLILSTVSRCIASFPHPASTT